MNETQSISAKTLKSSQEEKILQVDLPMCAICDFEGASTRLLFANLEGNRLKRNDYISYLLPGFDLISSKATGIMNVKDFGKTMTVKIKNSLAIYFDFAVTRWVYLS